MSLIIPIHGLKYHKFKMPKIKDTIILVKEKDNEYDQYAIAAYTIKSEKIGYISAAKDRNVNLFKKMKFDIICGEVWNVSNSEILVEINIK